MDQKSQSTGRAVLIPAVVAFGLTVSCSTLERVKSGAWPRREPKARSLSLVEIPKKKAEEAAEERTAPRMVRAVQAELSEVQEKLLEAAELLQGTNRIELEGRSYSADCSGTIRAIYEYAGVDLTSRFPRYTGNGVTRIYKMLEEGDLIYDTKHPSPGDIVFWDNTYDRNNDGDWNDELTHIGMVTDSLEDGTIRYTHFHYGRNSVVVENMNLLTPNVFKKSVDGVSVVVNAAMRIREKGITYPLSRGLTSHLYRIFGKGYLLEEN